MNPTLTTAAGMQRRVAPCTNCHRWLPLQAKGRCSTCYRYFTRNGYDRPGTLRVRHRGPGRPRCECGRGEARHRVRVTIGKKGTMTVTLRLCDDCLELERSKDV